MGWGSDDVAKNPIMVVGLIWTLEKMRNLNHHDVKMGQQNLDGENAGATHALRAAVGVVMGVARGWENVWLMVNKSM